MKLRPSIKDFGFVHCHPKNVHRMVKNQNLYNVLLVCTAQWGTIITTLYPNIDLHTNMTLTTCPFWAWIYMSIKDRALDPWHIWCACWSLNNVATQGATIDPDWYLACLQFIILLLVHNLYMTTYGVIRYLAKSYITMIMLLIILFFDIWTGSQEVWCARALIFRSWGAAR